MQRGDGEVSVTGGQGEEALPLGPTMTMPKTNKRNANEVSDGRGDSEEGRVNGAQGKTAPRMLRRRLSCGRRAGVSLRTSSHVAAPDAHL